MRLRVMLGVGEVVNGLSACVLKLKYSEDFRFHAAIYVQHVTCHVSSIRFLRVLEPYFPYLQNNSAAASASLSPAVHGMRRIH
jgi:hypothetical protein